MIIINMFHRVLPPPQTSSAQRQYEKERFKVQPGSIKDYSLGRGSLANKERLQVGEMTNYMCHSLIIMLNRRVSDKLREGDDDSHITNVVSLPNIRFTVPAHP